MRLPGYQSLTKATVIKYLKREDRKLLDHVPHGSFVCLRSWANGTSIYCFEFNKKYACGETTSRLHRDLPPIMDIDARPLKVIKSSLSAGESFYYMGKVRDTQINEDGNATLKFSVIPEDFVRYSENDRIQSALDALKEFVREKNQGVSLLRLAPWIVHILNSQEVEISTSATLITPQSLLSTKTIQISLHNIRRNLFLQLQLKAKKLIMILTKLSCRQWPMLYCQHQHLNKFQKWKC